MLGRSEEHIEAGLVQSWPGEKSRVSEVTCLTPRVQMFHAAKTVQSYGLAVGRGASKTFLLILQAHVLKQLLFHGKQAKKSQK